MSSATAPKKLQRYNKVQVQVSFLNNGEIPVAATNTLARPAKFPHWIITLVWHKAVLDSTETVLNRYLLPFFTVPPSHVYHIHITRCRCCKASLLQPCLSTHPNSNQPTDWSACDLPSEGEHRRLYKIADDNDDDDIPCLPPSSEKPKREFIRFRYLHHTRCCCCCRSRCRSRRCLSAKTWSYAKSAAGGSDLTHCSGTVSHSRSTSLPPQFMVRSLAMPPRRTR